MPRPKVRLCKYGHDISVVGRHGSCCAECSRLKHRKYYSKNKNKVLHRCNLHKLLKRYGLDEVQYECFLVKQNSLCAICHQPPTVRQLAVDHDHKTGRVRGLLCGSCNAMLGLAHDNCGILEAGIEYLKTN